MPEHAIRCEGIRKRYGDHHALGGFDLTVPAGTVYGLLGPNGAGKTTAVRVLTTLVRPDGGRAEVAGVDVAARPRQVRRRIGLAGQHAALDEVLTGRQNLRMFGRLFHLGRRRAAERADELLERFDLVEAADKGIKEYSGGMRRRLDLAAAMILAPDVLFLDEPTTGLDPRGRNEVWNSVRSLVEQGTTVLLTTQYLDEADRLAGRIAVLDRGRVIADDTPDELKRLAGADRIEVVVRDPATLPATAAVIARVTSTEPRTDAAAARVHAPVTDGVAALTEIARTLRDDGVAVADIGLRRPTLDEVFLRLTGHRADDDTAGEAAEKEGAGA
ncbi:daunorubicin/doxorubicin resistance ABC transporter ATP-binding protein DrrA [Actinomadura sp. CNU-125]|uniref:ATP-binding cassette domain-containing protein n=1 Tax=Actinomadura sp. CNU-125 TaxID=1904961 RepID=UPI0009695CAF|nr:ATP-binding cassette domain-containing protein [Actinomadura sp. CNU-125]OLT10071.1 daunorubicin/doxorubicin resistance ABC transporter ATP-binding protein DrrA [Actinomadura sp. CNU-125]